MLSTLLPTHPHTHFTYHYYPAVCEVAAARAATATVALCNAWAASSAEGWGEDGAPAPGVHVTCSGSSSGGGGGMASPGGGAHDEDAAPEVELLATAEAVSRLLGVVCKLVAARTMLNGGRGVAEADVGIAKALLVASHRMLRPLTREVLAAADPCVAGVAPHTAAAVERLALQVVQAAWVNYTIATTGAAATLRTALACRPDASLAAAAASLVTVPAPQLAGAMLPVNDLLEAATAWSDLASQLAPLLRRKAAECTVAAAMAAGVASGARDAAPAAAPAGLSLPDAAALAAPPTDALAVQAYMHMARTHYVLSVKAPALHAAVTDACSAGAALDAPTWASSAAAALLTATDGPAPLPTGRRLTDWLKDAATTSAAATAAAVASGVATARRDAAFLQQVLGLLPAMAAVAAAVRSAKTDLAAPNPATRAECVGRSKMARDWLAGAAALAAASVDPIWPAPSAAPGVNAATGDALASACNAALVAAFARPAGDDAPPAAAAALTTPARGVENIDMPPAPAAAAAAATCGDASATDLAARRRELAARRAAAANAAT